MNEVEKPPVERNKYTLRCPHCSSPAEGRYAMQASRSEPMICKQCGSPSWFKAPNGLPFLTVFLFVGVLSLGELLAWPFAWHWAFVGIAMPLVLMGDRYLTWRFGHMVRLPVHPLKGAKRDRMRR